MINHVEICGGMASGKTSLALLLSQYLGQAQVLTILEDYNNNPFWHNMYNDVEYDLVKNLTFILTHFEMIISADRDRICVCDFAMLENLAYADLSDPGDLSLIEMVYSRVQIQLPPPALIIKLICAPSTRLRRISKRGRRQEAEISETYLERLIAAIDKRLADEQERSGVPVFSIDTDAIDYVSDPERGRRVSSDVLAKLSI
jgi:deoxyadenosine/deoxycytidine kinase